MATAVVIEVSMKGEDGQELVLPLNPQKIHVETGAKTVSFESLQAGDFEFPRGQKVRRVSWDGYFIGESRKIFNVVKDWKSPEDLAGIISTWRDDGTRIKLTIIGTPINMDVFIADFTHDYAGGFGDVEYTLSLTEFREMVVMTEAEWTKAKSGGAKTKQAARATKAVPKTQTVKAGDSLWSIAQRATGSGSNWKAIYEANKSVIGTNPSKLKPGMSLRIPGGK